MTVCVAALCGGATVVIGATDRMLTSGDIEFEPEQTKTFSLTSSIVALVAGDAALQMGILSKVLVEVRERITPQPNEWLSVEEVGQMYVRHYNSMRYKYAENAVLSPLGLDGSSFIANQQKMSPQLVDKLARELLNFDVPETATIFAGVDNAGAHIYTASNGRLTCADAAGFSAIGAGAWHADSQLMIGGHTKWRDFTDTLHLIYASKKRSEIAPGVGSATDMFYIGPHLGSYVAIGDHVVRRLDEIYKDEQEKHAKVRQKSREQTNAYIQELTKSAPAKEQAEVPKDSGRTESANTEGTPSERPNPEENKEGERKS